MNQTRRLFNEIRAWNLQYFSITDHDCVDAYPVPEDLRERCVPGLEVDSHYGGHTVHILAYGIERTDSPLLQALGAQREDRLRRMRGTVERLNGLGLEITLDEVTAHAAGATSLGRPHLARARWLREGTLQACTRRLTATSPTRARVTSRSSG